MAKPLVWSTACVDWEKRIVKERSIIPPPIFPDYADRALRVFKSLRVVDLPKVEDAKTGELRHQTFGESAEPWVFNFVKAIFGAYNEETGNQLIREFFLLIAKKNTKSTIAAGIMVTALIMNWRDSNELLILAPTIEVAGNSFVPARDMVKNCPRLSKLIHVQDNTRTLTHLKTRAKLKVVAADEETVGGKKAAFILVDELWQFGKKTYADSMFREAFGGLASRNEGFVIWLSTQSDEEPAGKFKEKLDYFRAVRDGKIDDPKSLPVIYEYPEAMIEDESYLDPETWYIPNPNLDVSVSADFLMDEYKKTEYADDGAKQTFYAKHLNIQIGLKTAQNRWPGADHWVKNEDKTLTFETLLQRSEVIVVGGDGGGLDDLFGATFLGRCKETKKWLWWSCAWCYPEVLKRRPEISGNLRDFEKEGSLVIVQYENQDIQEFVDLCVRVEKAGLLPEKAAIGLDPQGMTATIDEFDSRPEFQDPETQKAREGLLQGVQQGYRLNGAIIGAERKLHGGTITVADRALMRWVAGNAKVERRGNAVIVTKQISGSAKIDPLMAGFNACWVMSNNPMPKGKKAFQMFAMG